MTFFFIFSLRALLNTLFMRCVYLLELLQGSERSVSLAHTHTHACCACVLTNTAVFVVFDLHLSVCVLLDVRCIISAVAALLSSAL